MNLKALCLQNIVDLIKSLPPMLQEEVIGESRKQIYQEVEKKVIKEIGEMGEIVVDDVSDRMIYSHKIGGDWKRPKYTNKMNNELYHMFVNISEQFVMKHGEDIMYPSNILNSDDDEEEYITEEEPEL